jgi:NAD(P) transhydrogenase subunit alpha
MASQIAAWLSHTLLHCIALGAVITLTTSIAAADEPLVLPTQLDPEQILEKLDSAAEAIKSATVEESASSAEYWSLLFVLALSTLIGLGVIVRVSRLLHTPLMSLTNAISAIAVVGAIMVTGEDHPPAIRVLGFIALFASTTNIVSGFLITDRMLKMFKQPGKDAKS